MYGKCQSMIEERKLVYRSARFLTVSVASHPFGLSQHISYRSAKVQERCPLRNRRYQGTTCAGYKTRKGSKLLHQDHEAMRGINGACRDNFKNCRRVEFNLNVWGKTSHVCLWNPAVQCLIYSVSSCFVRKPFSLVSSRQKMRGRGWQSKVYAKQCDRGIEVRTVQATTFRGPLFTGISRTAIEKIGFRKSICFLHIAEGIEPVRIRSLIARISM